MNSTKEQYKEELQKLKDSGEAPEWYTWISYQTVCGGYLYKDETPKGMYRRVAKAAARHLPDNVKHWEDKFFDVMWNGYLAPATPVLCNMGLDRGSPVSCGANYIDDSLDSIYDGLKENAILTKNGFGIASYLGALRHRGAAITNGGSSSGLWGWIQQYHQMVSVVTQNAIRRGAWAGYFEITHQDYYEVIKGFLNSDKMNLAVIISDEFIEKLKNNDEDALERYRVLLEARMIKGRPYIMFSDRANRLAPDHFDGNKIYTSQLCSEIFLPNNNDLTYTCVLSSMNASRFDEWKDTDAVQTSTVFLDCVAQEFIERAKHIKGMEKAVRFTEISRSVGLGLLGFHTYLQKKMLPFDSLPAQFENDIIFKHLYDNSKEASKMMARWLGEPEWLKGKGYRNSVTLAVAPNTSSALIAGATSQGIEPIVSNAYFQDSAKGSFERINPVFIDLLKSKGKYNKKILDSVALNNGSCQHLDFLNQEEKDVFKTAFEINQMALIRLAERRQKYLDQGQSLNLFFANDEDEAWIHEVHKMAFESDWIKSLYYVRSMAGIRADKGDECVSCEG